MREKNLVYTFASYAYHADTSWGHGTPLEGSELVASIAHKNYIPVTWIVSSESIKVLGDKIRTWHEKYGDDVILRAAVADEKLKSREEIRNFIFSEWQYLKEEFPWVETKIAARGKITNDIISILEELDFKGIWGYCWEQFWWDGITHKGIPWGMWYVNSNNFKAPHPGKGKIVGCEWTARDLIQAYHTGSPCIFSSDPDDVYRAGLCDAENIEYWKMVFDNYLRNTENNETVFFMQHQESHEMEYTDSFKIWPPAQIDASAKMLDNFFKYIKQYDITITTVPKAIDLYHRKNKSTAPCYMLMKDTMVRPVINEYNMTLGGVAMGPWPETFLYYDSQCQMVFVKGECRPRHLRNYMGTHNAKDDFTVETPPVFVTKFKKSDNLIEIDFEIEECDPVPFGLTYWDDLAGFEVKLCTNVSEAKIIQNKLVFLRFNLDRETSKIHLVLEKS